MSESWVSLCPCGSGTKYKFCCAKKMNNFDRDDYLKTFANETSA
ncbi:SEC-C metal-binding domain-containing protein [Paenibacillus sp. GCM10027626]